MRHEPLSREIQAGAFEPATDIELLMHAAWLLAGVAIALAAAGCTVADETKVRTTPADAQNENVAHARPASNATSGNVQDLTY